MKSGLYALLGSSATAWQAAWANWLDEPTTNVSNVYRGVSPEAVEGGAGSAAAAPGGWAGAGGEVGGGGWGQPRWRPVDSPRGSPGRPRRGPAGSVPPASRARTYWEPRSEGDRPQQPSSGSSGPTCRARPRESCARVRRAAGSRGFQACKYSPGQATGPVTHRVIHTCG